MRILLIGEHYSQNLGDGVISLSVRHMLKDKCEVDLLDLSQNRGYRLIYENYRRSKIGIKTCLLRVKVIDYFNEYLKANGSLKNYLNEFSSYYDAAIYVGGSIFMDYFAVKQYYINVWLNSRNVPVMYNACGMSSLSNCLFKNAIKRAVGMNNVKYISLRDSESEFTKLTNKVSISTYDNAIIVSDLYEKTIRNGEIIGIGFINKDKKFNNQYFKSIKELINRLNERKLYWEFFSNGDSGDVEFMMDCFNRLAEEKMIQYGSVADIPHRPEELIKLISGYERIITCRLHSAIIGYSYLIPTCAVSWDNKINCFYNKINHEELVLNQEFDISWIMDYFIDFSYDASDEKKLQEIKNEIKLNINRILAMC